MFIISYGEYSVFLVIFKIEFHHFYMKKTLDKFVKHLALAVVIASGLIMAYIIYELSLTKQIIGESMVNKVVDRTHHELKDFFVPIQNLLVTTAAQTKIEGYHNMDTSDFNQLFIPAVQYFPHLSSMGIADDRGFEYDIVKDSKRGKWLTRIVDIETNGMKEVWYSFMVDENYKKERDSIWERAMSYDPRSRPWFIGAVRNDNEALFWTDPYEFNTNGQVGITVSKSWIDIAEDTHRVIIAYDLLLTDISAFTEHLAPTKNGEVMILSGDLNNIIGLPRGNKQSSLNDIHNGTSGLIELSDIDHPELMHIIESGKDDVPFSFESGGQTWWGERKRFFLNEEQSFLIIIALPENDFLAEINESQQLMIGGFFGILLLSILILRSHNKQHKQRLVLSEKNKEITVQKELILGKNIEIMDSISCARRIQTAILPPIRLVNSYLNNSFVLFLPKDIVAGDFYWMERRSNKVLFAAADCTGHGVPGAMVSVMCHNALNRTVREFGLEKASDILNKTRDLVIEEFSKSESQMRDGMDISLCVFDVESKMLSWSGANNPLWIMRDGKLLEYKGDKMPVGNYIHQHPFTNHQIQLQDKDFLYVFTDGIQDQFGGPKNKKFKIAQLRELLMEIHLLPVDEQHQEILSRIESWRGNNEQVDDICLIGVSI